MYWPLIGRDRSHDVNAGLLQADQLTIFQDFDLRRLSHPLLLLPTKKDWLRIKISLHPVDAVSHALRM